MQFLFGMIFGGLITMVIMSGAYVSSQVSRQEEKESDDYDYR